MGKHEIVYSIGDPIVITRGPFTGRRGTVIQRVGFFTKKYILIYEDGGQSIKFPAMYLSLDKR